MADWTAPTSAPPTCTSGPGCDAPIHVGASSQTKLGPLTVNYNNNLAIGLKLLGNIQIVDGTQGAGKVLMSDENGIARWVSTSSLGIINSGVTNNFYNNNREIAMGSTWTVPTGVTSVKIDVWGEGGGGAYVYGTGGAAGTFNTATLTVTPGQVISAVYACPAGFISNGISFCGRSGTDGPNDCSTDIKNGYRAGFRGADIYVKLNGVSKVVGYGGGGGAPSCSGSGGTGGSAESHDGYTGGVGGSPGFGGQVPGGGGGTSGAGGAGKVVVFW